MEKRQDGGSGGHRDLAQDSCMLCVRVCLRQELLEGPRGTAEGLLEPGQGDSVAAPKSRLLGNCVGVPGRLVPPPPTLPSTSESSVELRPFPGRQAGAATWPGLWAWGKHVLGTWLSPELVPPFGSGWGAVGDELRPREAGPGPATSSLTKRGAPPPPAARRDGGVLPPPPRPRGSGPICTSVLANERGELAQPLPPLIPHPHSEYLGGERNAEWTF